MYKSKKAIMSILLIISILFIGTTASYKKAEASAVVVAGAVTVGALILTAVTMVASHNGIKLNITDKDAFTKYMADFFTTRANTNSDVAIWWNNIKNAAYDTEDTTKLMNNTFVNGVSSLFKYAIRSTIGFYMTLNQSVIEAIQDGIKAYYKYTNLIAGTVNKGIVNLVEEYMASLNLTIPIPTKLYGYKYIVVTRDIYNTSSDNIKLCGSMTPIQFVAYPENNLIQVDTRGSDVYYITYQYNKSTPTLYEYTATQWGANISTKKAVQNYLLSDLQNSYGTSLILTNTDMPYIYNGQTLWTFKSGIINYTIDAGAYETDITNSVVIGVNPYLEDTLKNLLNIDNVAESTNTDAIARAIDTADIAAEKVGTDVISIDLTDTTAVDNPIDTANEWYDVILNPLKTFAKWLFVPDKVVVTELIDSIQEKMDEQAGLLTYPLTLVIRFLMEVSELDVTDCILHIPKMEIFGYKFYDGCYYNLTQEIHKSDYAEIYTVYMYFTDFIMIIGFISLCIKKGDEMMKGGISPS